MVLDHLETKLYIMQNAASIKTGFNITIEEDFPDEIIQRRKQLKMIIEKANSKSDKGETSCPHVGVGEVSSEEVGVTLTNCVTGKLKFLY